MSVRAHLTWQQNPARGVFPTTVNLEVVSAVCVGRCDVALPYVGIAPYLTARHATLGCIRSGHWRWSPCRTRFIVNLTTNTANSIEGANRRHGQQIRAPRFDSERGLHRLLAAHAGFRPGTRTETLVRPIAFC